MNVYIFLATILVISIMFGLKKNSIMEGLANDKFCPENCVKPKKTSGNCATGNPIETKDSTGITKFFRKCSYTCLGPNDKGHKTFDLGVDEKYNVRKHGCRSTEQCGKCGSVKVNRKGKDLWYDLVQVNGSYVEQKKGNIIKRYFVEKPENKLDQNKMKKLDELKKKYGAQNTSGNNKDDKETKKSISSNQQNIADTTRSNMFTDITNASNVGKKDMSLEDYYQRRILNNNTENRLGGSKQALKYLKKMPQDNNGKVSFYNSAWKVFS
tara:strand:+ start:11517 stop:12320 length:804 start_codon:yes stop_codon:yes gene_type:complete